jgi:hypothetical protein
LCTETGNNATDLLTLASEKTDGGRVYRIAGDGDPGAIDSNSAVARPGI